MSFFTKKCTALFHSLAHSIFWLSPKPESTKQEWWFATSEDIQKIGLEAKNILSIGSLTRINTKAENTITLRTNLQILGVLKLQLRGQDTCNICHILIVLLYNHTL